MNSKLKEILPQNVSDETAFHLVGFVTELYHAASSHYFIQKIRHYDRLEAEKSKYYPVRDPF